MEVEAWLNQWATHGPDGIPDYLAGRSPAAKVELLLGTYGRYAAVGVRPEDYEYRGWLSINPNRKRAAFSTAQTTIAVMAAMWSRL